MVSFGEAVKEISIANIEKANVSNGNTKTNNTKTSKTSDSNTEITNTNTKYDDVAYKYRAKFFNKGKDEFDGYEIETTKEVKNFVFHKEGIITSSHTIKEMLEMGYRENSSKKTIENITQSYKEGNWLERLIEKPKVRLIVTTTYIFERDLIGIYLKRLNNGVSERVYLCTGYYLIGGHTYCEDPIELFKGLGCKVKDLGSSYSLSIDNESFEVEKVKELGYTLDNIKISNLKDDIEKLLSKYKNSIVKNTLEDYLYNELSALNRKNQKVQIVWNYKNKEIIFININYEQLYTWEYARKQGLSKEASAAVLANIQQESQFDTGANDGTNNEGTGAHGICQWQGERFKSLKALADEKNMEWTNIGIQVEFLFKELKSKSIGYYFDKICSTSYDEWKKLDDLNLATEQFEMAFERAGKPQMEKRKLYAKYYFELLKDTI